MMDKRFLILDIETVLDRELVSRLFAVSPSAPLAELQEAVRIKYSSGFLPPPFHRPVCIALVDVDCETCKIINAAVAENPDEKTLLQQFWKIVRFRKGNIPVKSTLVHFNGRGFDLPVLFYRSMKHRIPIVMQEDRSRYSFEESHDICDDLSGFGASSRPSLNLVAKLLGLPGKTDIDGSLVEEMHEKGERIRIKDYCMDDALATYYIWLTMRYIRGQLTEEKYREAYESAGDTVRSCRQVTDNFFSPRNNAEDPENPPQ
jgi:predicted PolB exonuclease-like 3'-5' exonuclease